MSVLWLARVSALLLFLFWGAFFVEHLHEWFLRADNTYPPLKLWIGQSLHLIMLLGLGTTLFKPGWGAIITVLGTASFFAWIGFRGFPYIALVNGLPVVLVLISSLLRKRQKCIHNVPAHTEKPQH